MNLRKTFYLAILSALALVAATGLLFVPRAGTSTTVSAQEGVAAEASGVVATPEMLSYALTHSSDPGDRYNYINQLPCQSLSGELSGKTVAPGVYCLALADLAGELILDGQNDNSSVFIFRISGALNAQGSRVSLANGAQPANVYFVAESASLSDKANFIGNILTKKSITVEDGSTLRGRTESLSGDITAAESAVAGIGSGTLVICKAIDPSTVNISDRIFQFTISGVVGVIEVPVGSCSSPIDVTAGMATISELAGGRTTTGGTFTGGFALVRVETLSQNSPSTVGTVNLLARTVNVNVVEGGIPQQLTVRFVNRFAVTGFVEICKAAAAGPGVFNPNGDPNVTGFFNFTIENFYQHPNSTALQVFTAPVGGCTGPLSVTILTPSPSTATPGESTVRVTELSRVNFSLDSVDTAPLGREVGQEILGSCVSATRQVVACPGGGYATVRVLEGGPDIKTVVNFRNRSNTNGAPAVPFDFDGDRRADVSVFRPSTGMWLYNATSTNGQQRAVTFGLPTDRIVPADYDGDGKIDTAVYRGGIWYILGSSTGFASVQFGLADDTPMPADYDGDGRADAAVFRPSSGVWYLLGSRDGFRAIAFGQNADVPVARDYDGDGKTDVAVYRNGTWYMLRSRDGFAAAAFGLPTDIPVPADYDGDGKADLAVYRSGTWFILGSTGGFRAVQFGVTDDVPVPADYDGDGRTDIAVYRSGIWYMIQSVSGDFRATQLGAAGDLPVPAAFLRR